MDACDDDSNSRKERRAPKMHNADEEFEELVEGKRLYSVDEKLESEKFGPGFVKEMEGKEFNLAHVQEHGFSAPMLFKSKEGLHIKVPPPDFSVKDIRSCVGSRRTLDVMDTKTQRNVEMSMKQWHKYWHSSEKESVLNVISLEFSHTRLENYVKAPLVVRQLDWTDRAWPRHLKLMQTEATNMLERMMYPKVQKYVLMSVKGCFTDFHIDFGGTSVWYHILQGQKVFFLIPPTPQNLRKYEEWTLSGKQSDRFLGDEVDKCERVTLEAGYTFFIPTGWIHAVYTPQDSIIFGGNFLHSFGIERQLAVASVEDLTHVPQKFRYPFFTEMLWYVLDRYVHCLLGRSYINGSDYTEENHSQASNNIEKIEAVNGENKENEVDDGVPKQPHVHITRAEVAGIKAIVIYLHRLPAARKNIPDLISDPVALIQDVRRLVVEHENDDPNSAITGRPLLLWPDEIVTANDVARRRAEAKLKSAVVGKKFLMAKRRAILKDKEVRAVVARSRKHRRVRCKQCEPCNREDCGKCVYCNDMTKFGGLNKMKQPCLKRQCIRPALPHIAKCAICEKRDIGTGRAGDLNVGLFECILCADISHPTCDSNKYPGPLIEIVDEKLSSWECCGCRSGLKKRTEIVLKKQTKKSLGRAVDKIKTLEGEQLPDEKLKPKEEAPFFPTVKTEVESSELQTVKVEPNAEPEQAESQENKDIIKYISTRPARKASKMLEHDEDDDDEPPSPPRKKRRMGRKLPGRPPKAESGENIKREGSRLAIRGRK